jgi:RNA polymerase sigma-70 factor (ECF subfamily)
MAETRKWQAWLAEHGPPLLLLARQRVRNVADAEDVVQEAFLRFWHSRHNARDPVAYLYACTRSHCLDWLRDRQRRARREEVAARKEPAAAPDFFAAIECDERRRLIEEALGALPHEQREVVIMKLWGNLSFAQIGQALSVPANTAASRYRYALEKLRHPLAQEPTT